MSYTGEFISGSIETVETAAARIGQPPSTGRDLYERIDKAIAMSRLYRECFAIYVIEHAMQHLTDLRRCSRHPEFDDYDRAAWERLESVRDWIQAGPPCARCGEGRGHHAHIGNFCPTRPGSLRLFLLSRVVETRCEGTIASAPWDASGTGCGSE